MKYVIGALQWKLPRAPTRLIRLCPGKAIGVIAPTPKTYESNFIHRDFVQIGKQQSRYEAILPLIVLSQQCCEAHFTLLR